MGSFGKNTNAVIYCRVSSSKQVREGHGLEGQEKRCHDYASNNNYHVINVFREEGISGGVIERPAMRRMLDFLDEQSGPTVVIIDDIKRLARDITGHFALRAEIGARQGIMESPSHRFEETPIGKLVESIFASTAEYERNENKVQVKNRMRSRLEAGYWVFNNPVGYKFVDDAVHGKLLAIDQPAASLIRDAFIKFSTDELLTLSDVRLFLRNGNLRNSIGNEMRLWLEGVKRILINPIYAGLIEYPKWDIPRMKGKHEAIITPETFGAVNQKLSGKRKVFRSGLAKDFPLRGFISCLGCGKPLTAAWSKGRTKRFAYYRCANSAGCAITPKSIHKRVVETDFQTLLERSKVNPRVLELAKRVTEEVYKKKKLEFTSVIEGEKNKIEEIQAEINACMDKILRCSSNLVISNIEERIEELSKEKKQLERVVEKGSNMPVDIGRCLENVSGFLEKPAYYWINGDLEQKRMVQSLVFTDLIEYSKETGFGTANLALPFRVLATKDKDKSNLVEAGEIEL
jgi:DNA invertase Pin-like site-specific DNA recombinase